MLRKNKILIVDDDRLSAFLSEKILNEKYEVFTVRDGYAALTFLEESNIHLILMDINLGDMNMDGIKTMKLIKQKSRLRAIKIVALTSFSKDRNWYINQGFDELLIKPMNNKSLDVINVVLQHAAKQTRRPELISA